MNDEIAQKYRKRPVEVEAASLSRDNVNEVERWCGGRIVQTPSGKVVGIDIKTLEGIMHAQLGDFVIKGVQGEFYPCKAHIFRATYEGTA